MLSKGGPKREMFRQLKVMLTIHELSIQIKRSKRRTLGLSVNKCQVTAHAPLKLPEQKIRDFIELKLPWIRKALEKQSLRPVSHNKTFEAGEVFLFLGEEYRLAFQSNSAISVQLEKGILIVYSGANAAMAGNKVWIQRQLKQWYSQQALKYLTERSQYFSKKMRLHYLSIKIQHYKSKWGSCSIQGHIHYNYLIMLAPPEIIDYLVVHELAHLKHHNHSPCFWQLVAIFVPQYKECRRWLKDNGALLRID